MHVLTPSRLAIRRLRLIALLALIAMLMAFTRIVRDSSPSLVVPGQAFTAARNAAPPLHSSPRSDRAAEWRVNGGEGGDHYSPLDDITRANVGSLRVAWVYRTGDVSDGAPDTHGPSTAFEATPLLLDSTLYIATPSSRVVALDPERGTARWIFDAGLERAALGDMEVTARGVAGWVDSSLTAGSRCRTRIFLATFDARLIALDGDSGTRCAEFGVHGTIQLRDGVRGTDVSPRDYHMTSPPTMVGDAVIVGSSVTDNLRVDEPSGVVRAFDARTGALRWSWEPLATYRARRNVMIASGTPFVSGAANSWGIFTADPAHDLVFIPTGSASPDHFGGLRPGDDRDANSIVALRASTGKEVWAFQLVHHDLWDYDVAAQPALATVVRNGVSIPAVVQASKTGMLFVLDRLTGKPLFPVEERPVPASDVPGEVASPTQPFPVLPRPLVPQGFRPDDAWGLSPLDKRACARLVRTLRSEGIFTPPSQRGSVVSPGFLGGMNWGGVAVDATRDVAVVNTIRVAMIETLIPRADVATQARQIGRKGNVAPQAGAPFGSKREVLLSPIGIPCSPPPWGTLAAVDLNTGGILWQVPLGTMSDFVHVSAPPSWGSPSLGGPLVTSTSLVFIAGAMDHDLRAFDMDTGRELWKAALPASAQASPMTYRVRPGGRQYLVIAAGGHHDMRTRLGDYLVAFTLP